jgi:predicted aconitase
MSAFTLDDASLTLTDEERAMLAGEAGEAARLAMRIVARLAPLYGATSLLPVTKAHIDGCIYQGEAGLAFAERLAELGGRMRVPTTLNVVSLDTRHWRSHGLDADYADKAFRLGNAYVRMGAQPTFTCAPYQTAAAPEFGEQIAWSESNAVAYANSVLGARTNRYGDFLDACCALTGRVPAAGLHLDEPRLGRVLVRLGGLPPGLTGRDDFYPVLGYLLGTLVADEPPVVEGIDVRPTDDQLKALAAAAATSGSIALLHVVGITPEAPTREAAFGGRTPERVVEVDFRRLQQARRELSTGRHLGAKLDVVAFGSPHCSLAECREIAAQVDGKKAASEVEVFVTTSRAVRDLLERSGDLDRLSRFGAKVTADTCIVVSPLVRPSARLLMTNSGKYAHYAPGLLRLEAVFGSTEECLASAVAGTVVLQEGPWAG